MIKSINLITRTPSVYVYYGTLTAPTSDDLSAAIVYYFVAIFFRRCDFANGDFLKLAFALSKRYYPSPIQNLATAKSNSSNYFATTLWGIKNIPKFFFIIT